MSIFEYLNIEIYGNTLWQWGVALIIAIAVYAAFRLVQKRGLHHIKKLTRRDYSGWSTSFLEALEGTKGLILLILALYAGASWLDFPDDLETNFRITAYAAFFIQLGLWVNSLLNSWIQRYRNRHLLTNPSAVTTVSAMRMVLKGLLWLAVLILILDNIGFDITTLVAGLGIGGIAVALALQNILGDLFSSLSIVLDKTFAVGDFLIIGEHIWEQLKISG